MSSLRILEIYFVTVSSVAATTNRSLSNGFKYAREDGANDILLSVNAANFVIFSEFLSPSEE